MPAWVDQTNAYIQEVDEQRIQREEEKFLGQFREVLKRPAIPWMYGAECGLRPEPVGRARGRCGSSTQRGWGGGRKSAKTRAGRSTSRIATSTSREVNSARGEIEFPSWYQPTIGETENSLCNILTQTFDFTVTARLSVCEGRWRSHKWAHTGHFGMMT